MCSDAALPYRCLQSSHNLEKEKYSHFMQTVIGLKHFFPDEEKKKTLNENSFACFMYGIPNNVSRI